MPPLVIALLQTWAVCALMMLVMWMIAVKNKNAGFVDMGWTGGLALCFLIFNHTIDGLWVRKIILGCMVCGWALRLNYHLVRRLMHDKTEDQRYQKLRKDLKDHVNLKFFFLFQLQAFLDVVLALAFLPILMNPSKSLSIFEVPAIAVWVIAFIGEIMADSQLDAFKHNPANKGKTCQEGLWNYSRHPNYFFEWLMWVGYALWALSGPFGYIGLIAPILMYHFLMNVTGVPLAEEQSLKSRGEEYRRYQQTTSKFIPLPKKDPPSFL